MMILMAKLHVMVVTTSRADYGLLHPLLAKMLSDEYFRLSLIVTGSHLSREHGYTLATIQAEGIPVAAQVEITREEDSEEAVCNGIAAGLLGFSQVIRNLQPDWIILLGDRYELWPAAIASTIHKVPIAHIHGGETTIGAIDESIRHSITKMAALHFPSIPLYAQRIVQMGESPERVFTVGALGLDYIQRYTPMGIGELSEFTGVDFQQEIALMTYHSVTLDSYEVAALQVQEVMDALMDTELRVLATMPNADMGGKLISNALLRYAELCPERFKLVASLGQRAYLSSMRHARLMIGNSSSGIIESASFKLPVVNIGDRQAGRFKPLNVIDVVCEKGEIAKAIHRALDPGFIQSLASLANPYGDGNAAERILSTLKRTRFSNRAELLKKPFYDLELPAFAGSVPDRSC